MGKRGGRAVDERNAAHVAGRGKTRKIPHHAAAQRQHRVAARKAVLQHHAQHLAKVLEAFGALSLRQHHRHALPALCKNRFDVFFRHAGIAHHQNTPVQVDELPYAFEHAAFDDDIVAAHAKPHCQFHSKHSFFFSYTPSTRTVRQTSPSARKSSCERSAE